MGDGWVAAYSTGNEPYGFRTPAVELETGERLVWLVELSAPPSIVEYPTFGNEGTLGLGARLRFLVLAGFPVICRRRVWARSLSASHQSLDSSPVVRGTAVFFDGSSEIIPTR